MMERIEELKKRRQVFWETAKDFDWLIDEVEKLQKKKLELEGELAETRNLLQKRLEHETSGRD